MVGMLASSVEDRGFEPRSDQTKETYKIVGYGFNAKHTPVRSKNKDWFAQNQDNVSKWNDMSIHVRIWSGFHM